MSAVKLQSANNGLGTEVEEGMVGGRSAPLFPSCNFDGKRRRDAKKKSCNKLFYRRSNRIAKEEQRISKIRKKKKGEERDI